MTKDIYRRVPILIDESRQEGGRSEESALPGFRSMTARILDAYDRLLS